MRTKPVLLVPLVALAALAAFATTAAAAPGRFQLHATTAPAAKSVPAAAVVPNTAAMLAGSAYPWVQPLWQTVDGVVHVTAPPTIVMLSTQPPAWVLSR